MRTQPNGHELLYIKIAELIEHQIKTEVLKIGDRLPSVRQLSKTNGVSVTTALQAYYQLEAKGWVEARPQSGYFVKYCPKRFPATPGKSSPKLQAKVSGPEEMISTVYENLANRELINLSVGVPSAELLPVAKLNKVMTDALRALPAGGTGYEPLQGNVLLRRQIARSALDWGGTLTESDIVTTAGCMNALSYSLMSVTQKGDTIALESPVYFGILQLAHSLGLNVIELPTDATTGVDPAALKNLMSSGKIKAVLLVSNFSNPLGCSIPDEHKKEIVAYAQRYGIPVIEDDLYGDVYFGKSRPATLKSFDEEGLVLWCGSISKTLAPGYRVGWVAPGRYLEKVKRLKMYHAVACPALTHEVIGRFLENGRYEFHLRKLRNTLHANSLQFIRSIGQYFPEGTRVSRPEGGFILWVELPKPVDTYTLYEEVLPHHISFAPGRMFTLQEQYQHCLRLSYGMGWNPIIEKALRRVGEEAGRLLKSGL